MKHACLKCTIVGLALAIFGLVSTLAAVAGDKGRSAAEDGRGPCVACHDDMTRVLPPTHPAINGTDLQSCMACHAPAERGVAQSNAFAVRIHRWHLQDPVNADCLACHSWEPGKSFGLPGTTEFYGAPTAGELGLMKEIYEEEMTSTYLAARHAAKGVGCAGCHGRDIAGTGGAVDNAGCLGCHGPLADLIVKTTPANFPDRNPHNSHLGEISCTVCHFAHAEAKIYCLECHPHFTMTIK